jgi:hypothetical protein
MSQLARPCHRALALAACLLNSVPAWLLQHSSIAWGTDPLATGMSVVQVLTWSAFGVADFNGNPGPPKTETATFNPTSGAISSATVTVTNHDMFCPGITMLGSGQIVVTGGNNAEKTSIYDVVTNQWKPGPNMIKARGYQASALLSTGEVCFDTISGKPCVAGGLDRVPDLNVPARCPVQ